ncbi:hypothetical protein C8R44DRAFT_596213, partial [Mycena epipterygia]
ILDWITPLNFFQRQADIFSAWQPGTGEWLLSDPKFSKWKSGPREILWCRGMPGAGKTVLSSLVVNHLRVQVWDSNTGIACIYLNHKETEAQTPTNLLASLWQQLVVDESLPLAVRELYTHHCTRNTKPSLNEVSGLLTAAVVRQSKFYFIVDALDEYPENQRNILLKHLSLLQGPTTSIMITSRPHITVEPFFSDFQNLEIRATENDIREYVDKHIQSSTRLSKHVRTRPELQHQILTKIINNVQGMFLLVKLHTESLTTKNTVKAVQTALHHLPTDLKDTYDEAMYRIRSQNEDDKQLALLALTWVAYAKRPLSVAELQEALAIETDSTTLDPDNLVDISIALSACAGLIIVDEA